MKDITTLIEKAKAEISKHLIDNDTVSEGATGEDYFFLTIKNKKQRDVACFFFDLFGFEENEIDKQLEYLIEDFIGHYEAMN